MRLLCLLLVGLGLSACDAWMHVKGQLEAPPTGYYNCSLLAASEPQSEPSRIPLRSLTFEESVHVAPGSRGHTYYISAECTDIKWQVVPAIYEPGVVVDLGTLRLEKAK
jgi:hypothetical protein